MSEFLTVEQHKEFAERIDAENNRQNKRIDKLEETFRQMTTLTVSVEKMATTMEHMAKEQNKQGEQLKVQDQKLDRQDEKINELKIAPAKKWDNLSWLILSALATGILGYILGMVLV